MGKGDKEEDFSTTESGGKNIPRPRLSRVEIDGLLQALTATNEASDTSDFPKLTGREVLVPAFGNVAFYEGELRPETRPKPGSSTNETEEIVYVSTAEPNQTTRLMKQQKTTSEKDIVPVSLSDAIEWLRKYSSQERTKALSKSLKPEATATPKKAIAKLDKARSPKIPPASTEKSTARLKPSQSHAHDTIPVGPMFNINEEYSADGRRIVSEAVNLSSRLKAVYGDDNPDTFNRSPSTDESKIEAEDAPFDPTLFDQEGLPQTDASAKEAHTKVVSDEEYHRISMRLEELALMEEEESKRIKERGRRPAKPLGGGSSLKNSQKSPFGFKKGFLNKASSSSNSRKKKSAPETAVETKPVTTSTITNTAMAAVTSKKSEPSSTKASSGVTIDVSQNRVHEIPREGRQQPVPPRHPQQQQSMNELMTESNRLLDSSVFSGYISERKQQPPAMIRSPVSQSTPPARAGIISRDVAARVVANEQTQSLQHELELKRQQQQHERRPKRVSRFKQQRQQEQQQQQR